MPACAVQNQQGDGVGADAAADLRQVQVHDIEIHRRHDQGSAGPTDRADGTKQVSPGKPPVALDPRSRAAFGPDATYRALLADAGFILEPDFDCPPDMPLWDRGAGQFSEVFLKVS